MQFFHLELRTISVRRPIALVVACALALMAGCGEKKKDASASQTAAKVNNVEIALQQIDQALQQQRGLKPEQVDAAARQVLERLIDQELALQKAAELKLDREPAVLLQLEAARREVMSRAYVEKAGESVSKPTADEVAKYYQANPALFSERRIYSLQEIHIDATPDRIEPLRRELANARNVNEFLEYLKSNGIRYSANQAVRSAEQLPISSLSTFSGMKDGQALLNATPNGAVVIVLAGSASQPVTLEAATPAIEQFLLNARKREALAKGIKALRSAATVEYVGKFAETAASGSASASAAGGAVMASEPAALSSPEPSPKPRGAGLQ